MKEQVSRIEKELDMLNKEQAKMLKRRDDDPMPKLVAAIQAIDVVAKVNARKEQLKEELLASQTYITSGFGASDSTTDGDDSNNEAASKQSKIVSILMVEGKNQILSIDCHFLMRVWSLQTKKQVTALLVRSGQHKEMTCAAIDGKEKHLAISDEEGLITIHNIHSGGVLHSLPKIGSEITKI